MPSDSGLDLERDLNPEQLEAVTHGDGPQLVLAGAGSGKTRVITYRIAWLIQQQGVDPRSIVAVTFTNKAAREMRERLERLLGLDALATFLGTFHRFSLDLLRRHGEAVGLGPHAAIFDRNDQLAAVKKALEAEQLSEQSFPPRTILGAISAAKGRLIDPQTYEARASGFFETRVARVYRRYQGMLQSSSGLDFDDMLRLAVKLLEREQELKSKLRGRISHLLVDEFQDTNFAQMRLITELVSERGNLTAVGDEDQGIYRWRGADLDNVLDFEASFPGATVRKLERNYRSTQRILEVAGELVRHNRRRRGKRLWTDSEEGEPPELYRARDEQDEAHWLVGALEDLRGEVPLEEMGILVRTNAQTRAFEEELLRRRLPYELVGGTRFYERAEIKDLLAYLRVLRNPRDNFSLERILNKPPRGIGDSTRSLLQEAAREFGGCLWEALCQVEMGSLPARSARALTAFRELIQGLIESSRELDLPALLERLLEATGYAELYQGEDEESQSRLENIREFLTAAQEYYDRLDRDSEPDALAAFLDHASLVADIDEWQSDRGLALMTLHSAKGLEFEAVAVGGLEEGLLPHFNAGGEPDDIEEERRLLYVGMTRAKRRLFLSCCRRRRIAGRYQDQEDSRFLGEIPESLVTVSESPELFYGGRTRSVYSYFGRQAPAVEEGEGIPGDLGRGRRVRHPTLGEGVVLETEGSGESTKLTVFFDRAGKRKLLARYANLESI